MANLSSQGGTAISPTIEEQIERLKRSIYDMEAQREALGDEVLNQALLPLHKKLDELNRILNTPKAPEAVNPIQQRKLLTILFMDIVGSTAIIQHMDPEEVSEIFDANLKYLAGPAEEHGGKVTSFMGDGFMALFGAPISHEDDPEQAVRAGLSILNKSEEIGQKLYQEWQIQNFKVRVGINTGLVILGGETEGEDTTKGPAVHLAARLQSTAPPGGMLISHDTYRHVRGVFNVEAWEPVTVKGFDEPVKVYRVLSAKPRSFRSYSRGVEGVETRMVGRSAELEYLQDAFSSAIEDREGKVITMVGEAGVGKSRLLYEFQNWIDLQPSLSIFYEGRAHQEAQGIPLGMLRDLFEFRFQLQENDTPEAVREKVEAGLMEVFSTRDEGQMRTHILGQWLGFDFSTSPFLKGVISDSEQLRNRGLMYLGDYFKGLCEQSPVIVFLEDIHWADDSSLDAINWLGEQLYHQPLLFVCATRHSLLERRPYWGEGLNYHHRLNLEPLSTRESHQLVGEILKLASRVPDELYDLVVEGAEGNPFYVEELVKMLVEDGVVVKGEDTWQVLTERLSEIKVPPTLAGVLQARLESLPREEQQVLQQASVVGRLFWDQVVAHIQSAEGGKPQAVPEALSSLRGREMVYRREASAFADSREYMFKHDILREVTYESVLKRLRKRYHGFVADWLISQVSGTVGGYSGLIAGHLLQAGRKEQAGKYLLLAGEVALETFANVEAEAYFRQALEQPLEDGQKAVCLAGLGEALYSQGNIQESVAAIRQGIEISLEHNDQNTAASLYATLSRFLWVDDYGKAWEACQEGLGRLEGAPPSAGMAKLLAEAGREACFIARPAAEVTSLCDRAIVMAESQGELAAKSEAMVTSALVEPEVDKAIKLLQEAITISESNQLWNTASRAHTNIGALSSQDFRNANEVYKHFMQTVEIDLRTGELEGLFFSLNPLTGILIDIGQMSLLESKLREILRNSTATQARIDEYLNSHLPLLHLFRGEWVEALEFIRQKQAGFRDTKQYQMIASRNMNIALAYLDLYRFKGEADLSEAETALKENTKINWFESRSRFFLVVVVLRQKRFSEARQLMAEAISRLKPPVYQEDEFYRALAEIEFAKAEDRWDEVITKCQALVDLFMEGNYRWYQAWQLIDLGDSLVCRNQPGDIDKAKQVYQQSLDMFTEMGAPGYIQALEMRLKGM